MQNEEIVVKHLHEENKNTSSLEIGSPTKGGTIKVYGNPDDQEGFKRKIDAMVSLREYAESKMPKKKEE